MKVATSHFGLDAYRLPRLPRLTFRRFLVFAIIITVVALALIGTLMIKNQLRTKDLLISQSQHSLQEKREEIIQLQSQLSDAKIKSDALTQEVSSKEAQIAGLQNQLSLEATAQNPDATPGQANQTSSDILNFFKNLGKHRQ